jgi:hypothetical protein
MKQKSYEKKISLLKISIALKQYNMYCTETIQYIRCVKMDGLAFQ